MHGPTIHIVGPFFDFAFLLMTSASARCTMSLMTVDVLLFASYAETLGGPKVSVDLSAGATVRDLLEQLRKLPGAERLPPSPMIAVNHRYARATDTIAPGDEIAVIPPVAGG